MIRGEEDLAMPQKPLSKEERKTKAYEHALANPKRFKGTATMAKARKWKSRKNRPPGAGPGLTRGIQVGG
jgi:hypothetical protein